MPIYELALWDQGSEAVRITDKPVSVGQTLLIDDIKWLVEAQELPRDPKATARYVSPRGDLLQPTSAREGACRSSARTRQRWEHEYDLERRGARPAF